MILDPKMADYIWHCNQAYLLTNVPALISFSVTHIAKTFRNHCKDEVTGWSHGWLWTSSCCCCCDDKWQWQQNTGTDLCTCVLFIALVFVFNITHCPSDTWQCYSIYSHSHCLLWRLVKDPKHNNYTNLVSNSVKRQDEISCHHEMCMCHRVKDSMQLVWVRHLQHDATWSHATHATVYIY